MTDDPLARLDVLKRTKLPLDPERAARILYLAVQRVTLRNAEAIRTAEAQRVDPDLLRTLEIAIRANNVDVIDALMGLKHPRRRGRDDPEIGSDSEPNRCREMT